MNDIILKNDILVTLSYTQFLMFEEISQKISSAPSLGFKIALGELANNKFRLYKRIFNDSIASGIDIIAELEKLEHEFKEFKIRIKTTNWTESLMNLYILDDMFSNFFLQSSKYIPNNYSTIMEDSITKDPSIKLVEDEIVEIAKQGSQESAIIALWGRRIAGESLKQIQDILEKWETTEKDTNKQNKTTEQENLPYEKILANITTAYAHKMKILHIIA